MNREERIPMLILMEDVSGIWGLKEAELVGKSMVSTGDWKAKKTSLEEVCTFLPGDYIEVENEIFPMIFGKAYRGAFMPEGDLQKIVKQNQQKKGVGDENPSHQ